jgi:putative spermidine/putrescine transport system permease protein
METRATRIGFGIATALVILFLWIPILIILAYAFNGSVLQTWPVQNLTLHWFHEAWNDQEVRSALWLSVKIALPGIITGMALSSFYTFAGIGFSIWTIIIGHTTFCVVVVYNNVLARLRRSSPSIIEASMDLGADGWQTFRFVVWPVLSTALVAGGLLAFALSFDEVIVTTFTAGAQTTLPIWILDTIQRGQQLPVVNAVVFVVVVLTVIPVIVSQRLTQDSGLLRRR